MSEVDYSFNIEHIRAENKALKEDVAALKQVIADRESGIANLNVQELQASLRNHHEQFNDLKSNTEVVYKAIAMMLEALKGDRKPDEIRDVDGVMVKFRNYDDTLTHHQKNIIIGNIQRAIGNEIKKLKGRKLIDISYDEQPF